MKKLSMIVGMLLAAALVPVWAAEDVPTVYLGSPITEGSTFADGTIARVWPDQIELQIPEREVPEPLRPVINTNTVISIDGKPARPADLRVGMAAHVVFADAQQDTAKEIKAQSATPAQAQFDPERAKQATVVLRVRGNERMYTTEQHVTGKLTAKGTQVRILEVLKNKGPEKLAKADGIEILWKPDAKGLPAAECTVYLEPYRGENWKEGLYSYRLIGADSAPDASAAPVGDLMEAKLAQMAPVVLRVRLLTRGEADKYAWYEVEILKVLKNESGEPFGQKLKIAAYSWKPGVPEGESTVYLERYNATDKGLWKLVGGEAATGVSHAQKPAEAGTNPPAAIAWQDLFAGEDWYKSQPGKETIFAGKLEAVPQVGGVSTLQRNSYYKLGDRTIYTGARKMETLDRLVGRVVEIRGKAVEMELEGQSLREIWPAAIRPAQ